MSSIEILIVDDHEPMRRVLRSLVESRPGWHVCGEAVNGKDAVEKAKGLKPNLVLLDVSMPEMNGLEATRIIRRDLPEAKVILVSQNDPALVRRQAAEVQAHGCVGKPILRGTLYLHSSNFLIGKILQIFRSLPMTPSLLPPTG